MSDSGGAPLSLPPWLAAPAERVLGLVVEGFNHVLRQHDWARAELRPFAGSEVAVIVRGALGSVGSRMRITSDGELADAIHDADGSGATIRVVVPMRPGLLLALARVDRDAVMREVSIDGDAGLAAVIGRIAPHVRWDVEDDLSRVVGGIAARRIVDGGRQFVQAAQRLGARGQARVTDYAFHEGRMLVSRPMFDELRSNLRALRDDIDRVELKLAAVAGTGTGTHGGTDTSSGTTGAR